MNSDKMREAFKASECLYAWALSPNSQSIEKIVEKFQIIRAALTQRPESEPLDAPWDLAVDALREYAQGLTSGEFDGSNRLMPANLEEAADAIEAGARPKIGSGLIYQVWYFDGGWRDVPKAVYDKESHRDDVRIVYLDPQPTQQCESEPTRTVCDNDGLNCNVCGFDPEAPPVPDIGLLTRWELNLSQGGIDEDDCGQFVRFDDLEELLSAAPSIAENNDE